MLLYLLMVSYKIRKCGRLLFIKKGNSVCAFLLLLILNLTLLKRRRLLLSLAD